MTPLQHPRSCRRLGADVTVESFSGSRRLPSYEPIDIRSLRARSPSVASPTAPETGLKRYATRTVAAPTRSGRVRGHRRAPAPPGDRRW